MLGDIPVLRITDYNTLIPSQPNCVEVDAKMHNILMLKI